MKPEFVIYGSKGHAGIVADLIQDQEGELRCFFDDFDHEAAHQNQKEIVSYDPEKFSTAQLIIGVGNNANREEISNKVQHRFGTLIHSTAFVSEKASIGEGTVVLANATIQANAHIGKHVIITAGVCIDHDVIIDDYVIVYPNSYIGGEAQLKKGVCIGPCSVVTRKVIVPENTEIAALSIVD